MKNYTLLLYFLYCIFLYICGYQVKAQQEKFYHKIKLCVRSDFPNEILNPEVAMLNGEDIREHKFKAGKYCLEIQHPGFFSIKEEFTVPQKEKTVVIKKILISMPRTVKERISFDVPSPSTLKPYKITLKLMKNPKKEKVLKEGDKIKPGKYILCISKEGYLQYNKEKYVWPSAEPIIIKNTMHAKLIPLSIHIVSETSLQKLPQAYVEVRPICKKNIGCWVKTGSYIKPGKYHLSVYCNGYKQLVKEIDIPPSEKPYTIFAKMVAKSRPFLVMARDPLKNSLIFPVRIFCKNITNDRYSWKELRPGKKYTMVFQFKRYKTIEKEVEVKPGEGPILVDLPKLKKLRKYEVLLLGRWSRYIGVNLDGTKYPYSLYIDFQLVEPHLIDIRGADRGIQYTVWTPEKSQNIQIFAGYMYAEKKLSQPLITVEINSINIPLLIKHLEQVAKESERDKLKQLQLMEKKLHNQQWRNILQKNTHEKIDKLKLYFQKLKIKTSKEKNCKIRILQLLDKKID